MSLSRDDIVTNLIPKDKLMSKIPIGYSCIMETFHKAFSKQVTFDSCEDTGIETIVDPFEELHVVEIVEDNIKKEHRPSNTTSKWGLLDLAKFSPKYLVALDRVQPQCGSPPNITLQSYLKFPQNKTSFVDDEWKTCIQNYIQEECKVDITWPSGLFNRQTVVKSKNHCLPNKKNSLTPAPKRNGTKKSREVKTKATIPSEYKELLNAMNESEHCDKDQVYEPPTWKELEIMRIKCEDWLAHYYDPSKPKKKQ